MRDGTDRRRVVDAIERVIHEDVGRNIAPLFEVGVGGLAGAASAIAGTPRPVVGLISGFFVPLGRPPAAETDGPVGAALLAAGLAAVGVRCRLATDSLCASACHAALAGAGIGDTPVDAAEAGAPVDGVAARWAAHGVTAALAVERCGPGRDGVPRNMRGMDLSRWTAPLHGLFEGGPWRRLAIGDGGNEIGMGAVPADLIARHISNGATIASAIPAEHLIVAGVSNWGCYALIGALAVLRPDWRDGLLPWLDGGRDRAILEAMVRDGPAVDGVTGEPTFTVDGLPMAAHHAKLAAIRRLVEAG